MMRLSWICVFLVITLSLAVQGLRPNFKIQLLHEDQCGSVVKIDCLPNNSRRVPRSVHGQSRPTGPLCAQLTDSQLMKKLKDIGGYNPLYVAINESEAKKFKDPRKFEMTKETKNPIPTRVKDCTNSPTPTTTPTTTPPTTTPPTTTPKQMTTPPVPTTRSQHFHYLLRNEKNFKRQPKRFFPVETLLKRLKDRNLENIRHRVKRAIQVKKEDCWTKGGSVSGSNPKRIHMCSECRVTTKLPGDTFPPYINEAACGFTFPVQSGTASQDNQCYAASGLCVQKIIKMPALKRSGYLKDEYLSGRTGYDVYTEQWITWYKDIKASCQCQVYTGHGAALKAIQGSL